MTEQIKQPPGEIVAAIMQILESRGVIIPPEHIDMTTAAMCHWLETEKRGHEYMSHLQQLDVVGGRNEKVYKLRDGFGRLTRELEPESILFLRGCLVKGEPVPVSLIEITDREIECCDSCGSYTICTKTVETSYNKTETLCSNCLGGSGDLSLKDQVTHECENCSYTDCNWNPVNADVPPYNPAI